MGSKLSSDIFFVAPKDPNRCRIYLESYLNDPIIIFQVEEKDQQMIILSMLLVLHLLEMTAVTLVTGNS